MTYFCTHITRCAHYLTSGNAFVKRTRQRCYYYCCFLLTATLRGYFASPAEKGRS